MGNIRGGMNGFLGTIGQPTAQVIDSSLKFKGGQYLERTSTAGNQTTWTWSGWIKVSDLSGNNIFGEDGGYPNASASFNTSGVLRFTAAAADSSVFLNVIPSALFRDFSAWYHFVIVYDSGNAVASERARVYVNGRRLRDLSTATYPSQNVTTVVNSNGNAFRIGSHSGVDHLQGYQSNAYLIDGQAIAPGFFGFTDPLTGTWRPKRLRDGDPTASDGRTFSGASISGGGSLSNLFDGNASTSATQSSVGTPASVTGFGPVRVASHVSFYSPDGAAFYTLNGGKEHRFYSAGWHEIEFSGSLREFTWIGNGARIFIFAMKVDGVELVDATTTNINFGVNGFYLPMDDEDRFRLDQSGKNNHFSESGWSGTSIDPDVVKDSPSGAISGGRGQTGITTTSSAPSNYCTWNPLNKTSTSITTSDGNLKAQLGSTGHVMITGNMAMLKGSGKYYWEIVTAGWNTSNQGPMVGIVGDTHNIADQAGGGPSLLYRAAGEWYVDGSETSTGHTTFTTGDVIGVALDLDRNIITWYKNGSQLFQYTSVSSSVNAWIPAWKDSDSGGNAVANWGQKPFKYAPPQGYLPLNSATARPNKVVTRPDQYVGVVTYTSNSGSAYEVSGLEFSPDLIITKNRDNASGDWNLQDTVCGITSVLTFNANYAASAQTDNLHTVTANGFKIGTGSRFNSSSQKICSWFWKAGGPKIGGQGANEFWIDGKNYASAAAAGLDDGTITPVSASVGTKQGFSIVRWNTESLSGTQSLDTGLTEAPEFVITKVLDQADDWLTFHKDLSSTETLIINGNRAKLSNAAYARTFNSDGTISGMPVGGSNWWISSRKYVFYSWHSVPGLQKFGKYKGNSSNDGPFVELGFRPSVLLIKRYDGAGNWILVDNERNKVNVVDKQLLPNSSGADYTEAAIDFVSNGFKVRLGSSGHVNIYDFVYAAWAEAPASNLFGGQSNAR